MAVSDLHKFAPDMYAELRLYAVLLPNSTAASKRILSTPQEASLQFFSP